MDKVRGLDRERKIMIMEKLCHSMELVQKILEKVSHAPLTELEVARIEAIDSYLEDALFMAQQLLEDYKKSTGGKSND